MSAQSFWNFFNLPVFYSVYFTGNLIFVGILYTPLFLIGCGIITWLSPRNFLICFLRIVRLGLFFGLLLLFGDIFSSVWTLLIYGNFYYSTDYCGIDFLPFFPVTQGTIDAPFGSDHGELFGVSLSFLQFLWFFFALGTWCFTFYFYDLLVRRNFFIRQLRPA